MGRARGRMLAWRISESEKVNGLSCGDCMLLYTWLLAHCDNLGRFHGEPDQVRSLVLPRRRDISSQQVASWLQELSDARLILWYVVGGMRYIAIPEEVWSREQRLHSNMSRHSDLPPPTEDVRKAYGSHTSNILHEVEVELEVEGEGEGEFEGEGEGERERKPRNTPKPVNGHVNPVRTRTEPEEPLTDPGPAFWNSEKVADRLRSLHAVGLDIASAKRVILREGQFPGLKP